MPLTHRYTIICDDLRREDNGKLIVLGMYMGTITIPQLPFILPTLTILALMDVDRPESLSWKMTVQHLERGRTILEARGFLTAPQPGPVVMPVKFGGVRLDEGGTYHAVLGQEGHPDPIMMTPFNVVLMPPTIPGQPARG